MDPQQLSFLLEKYKQGKCTREELAMLHVWYDNLSVTDPEQIFDSVEHRKAIQMDIYRRIRQTIDQAAVTSDALSPARSRLLGTSRWWQVAASIVLLVGIGWGSYWWSFRQPALEYKTVITQSENHKQITLTDGSVVYLNANSSLRYPQMFGSQERRVFLEGEAFFQVAHNPQKPFIIVSRRLTTRVLGTSFNVKTYANDLQDEVAVVTGTVSVEANDDVAKKGAAAPQIMLTAGYGAIYQDGNLSKISIGSVKDAMAWREKQLIFRKTAMVQLARTLERMYGISIAFETPAVGACQINARFDKPTLDQVLTNVCLSIHATYRQEGKYILIRGNGCGSPAL